METPKKIHLLGDGRHEEAVAAGAITPGHLIALDANGKVVVNADAGDECERLFAVEDALQGKGIDDAYAVDDPVSFVVAQRGEVIYALLADGEDVETGDFLTSNGDGTLKAAGSDTPLAVALDTLDLSESSNSTAGRIRVRVL